MAGGIRFLASAAVGSLMVLGLPLAVRAQADRAPVLPNLRVGFAQGAIDGFIKDEQGQPISGVVVSALGATTTVAITDRLGRFQFVRLSPGPYSLRAHLNGYQSPRAQSVQVSPNARVTFALALRRTTGAPPVLAAGLAAPPAEPVEAAAVEGESPAEGPADDHSETAWRLRHARRGVLKDILLPLEVAGDGDLGRPTAFLPTDLLERAINTPARAATSFFVDTEFSGQVNLLTTGTFDSPQQFFSADTLSRNVAYVRLGAPVGEQGDWTVRGAMNQADISSWIVAGSYATRAATRHRYDIGLSYSTQRYDGGNVLALRDVSDGSRNAGTVYAYDTFALTPSVAFGYGAAYSRYDYLDDRSLISPRVALTITPNDRLRLSAAVSRRALAPGAEEFLPPGDTGIWLPPQRTFSSLSTRGSFSAEQTAHSEFGVERDFGTSTVGVRAFRQHVDDQLVTMFGAELPGEPTASVGHYAVGNIGDVDASGWKAQFRTLLAGRLHGSVEYTMANARTTQADDLRYLVVLAPVALRPQSERLHTVASKVEAEVPETATRILVLYRVGAAVPRSLDEQPNPSRPLDARFDVQVRQSLPFMNFSNARWEMLVAVRNFFRESGPEQSVYDELLVVRPPKRIVGGVSLRF